ncbi:MAG TPA: radical SAM protein [Polyangiales bacterium]|nr:radical SAM protein [Polyangiales bacterium]
MATDSLVIHEIYRSIQGETSFAGRPCTLVRLSGCNLRCRWCDTTQAFYGGTRMPRAEVVRRALELATPLVLVTGGEPLLQPGAIPLLAELCDAGRTVLLETSGERDISAVDPRVHRILDMKAPGSNECAKNRYENLALLGDRDQLKVVIASREDYQWARDLIVKHAVVGRAGEVLLSPVHGELDPRELVAWTLEDALNVRVQVQLHKYIWGRDAQGV